MEMVVYLASLPSVRSVGWDITVPHVGLRRREIFSGSRSR